MYLSDVAPAIDEHEAAAEHRCQRHAAVGIGSPIHSAVVVSV
jgi:hypothetical protein